MVTCCSYVGSHVAGRPLYVGYVIQEERTIRPVFYCLSVSESKRAMNWILSQVKQTFPAIVTRLQSIITDGKEEGVDESLHDLGFTAKRWLCSWHIIHQNMGNINK
jgi:hypothetical protein